ncbi:hypothetical protein [Bacteroides pyogenes]|uniref:hypothetical protein n=1 Tax=Bacteroides pyogenes TaxID=310300 RepID=UPI001652EC49|nr:hypothetical protein [Bacteroides pyogenes]
MEEEGEHCAVEVVADGADAVYLRAAVDDAGKGGILQQAVADLLADETAVVGGTIDGVGIAGNGVAGNDEGIDLLIGKRVASVVLGVGLATVDSNQDGSGDGRKTVFEIGKVFEPEGGEELPVCGSVGNGSEGSSKGFPVLEMVVVHNGMNVLSYGYKNSPRGAGCKGQINGRGGIGA